MSGGSRQPPSESMGGLDLAGIDKRERLFCQSETSEAICLGARWENFPAMAYVHTEFGTSEFLQEKQGALSKATRTDDLF